MELGFCSPKPRFLVANTVRMSFGNFTCKHHAVYWGWVGWVWGGEVPRVIAYTELITLVAPFPDNVSRCKSCGPNKT